MKECSTSSSPRGFMEGKKLLLGFYPLFPNICDTSLFLEKKVKTKSYSGDFKGNQTKNG